MKKILTLLFASLLLYACGDTYETYEGLTVDNAYYTVKPSEWRSASDEFGLYYYCQKQAPKLTNDVFQNGFVLAYLDYTLDGVDILYPLPFDDFYVSPNNPDYFWTEQVTAEFAPGYVTFILKYSDQRNDTGVPDFDYNFKVVFGRNVY